MSWLCIAREPPQLHASRTGLAAWNTRCDPDRPGNVGYYLDSNDIAIVFAHEGDYGIAMLQEPWIRAKDGECETRGYCGYQAFRPVHYWEDDDTRPRVITYARWADKQSS